MAREAPDRAVRAEYEQLARVYEDRWAAYVRATVDRTVARLALRPGERLLDVGCGTAALLRVIQARHPLARTVGVDLTPGMLRVGRLGLGSGALLVAGDAGALPLPPAFVDVVVSSSSFHYWSDPPQALAEIRRVLRHGGRLVITDWCDDFLACRVADRVLRFLRHSYRRIYGSGECRRLLERAGFEVTGLERYKVGWLWGMMTVTARSEVPA